MGVFCYIYILTLEGLLRPSTLNRSCTLIEGIHWKSIPILKDLSNLTPILRVPQFPHFRKTIHFPHFLKHTSGQVS